MTVQFAVEDAEFLRIDDQRFLARIYRPSGPGPFPAVIDVHGGVWVFGDRMNDAPIAEHLAQQGVVVVSVDFRVPPIARYPAPVADIAFAICWLARHAATFNVSPEAIFGLGASSGGHQLMLAAMRPDDPRYRHHLGLSGNESADTRLLRGVIACWPVLAPVARYEMARKTGNERLVDAHHAYWPDLTSMSDGDPQLILERGEAVTLPPLLIIQGTHDENLTPDMADRFAATYAAAGGQVTLEKFEGQPHGFINGDPGSVAATKGLALIADFVLSSASASSAPATS